MTIHDGYRVTLLVAPEDRDGKLTPQQVHDYASTLGAGPGAQWDHPPETEILEVAAPGAWSDDVERPVLNHTYGGLALRLTCFPLDADCESHAGVWETIGGAFRVLCRLPDGGAIVGNGEKPEQFWRTAGAPERVV